MDHSVSCRVVQIEVPLKGGTYNYFSGYIFSDGVVLTCLHGFKDRPDYDAAQKIVVKSFDFETELTFESSTFDALLLEQDFFLCCSDKFDMALMHCAEAKGNYQEPLLAKLTRPGEWEAGGYPFFQRENQDTKGYKNFNGSYTAVEPGAVNLSLTVLQPQLSNMNDWGSVSGSPVFVHGQLVGVLRRYSVYSTDDGRDGVIKDQLEAGYLKNLLAEDDTFRAVVTAIGVKSRCYHQEQFTELLDDALRKFLAKHLNVSESAVLTALQNEDRTVWLEAFVQAKKVLPSHKTVDDAFLYLLSLGYERSGGFEGLTSTELPYSDVPVVREEGCEFFMAANDQRPPVFRKTDNGVMPSKYCMTASPEIGISDDTTADVTEAFLSASADENAVIDRIFGDFKPSRLQSSGKNDEKRRRKVVQIKLQKEKHHYYWPLDMSEADQARIEKVHQAFPQIKILNVSDDVELDVEEEELFSELAQFIKDHPHAPASQNQKRSP